MDDSCIVIGNEKVIKGKLVLDGCFWLAKCYNQLDGKRVADSRTEDDVR